MKRRLIWTVPVVKELEQQIKYLANKSPDSAKKIIQKLFSKIKILENFPDIGRPISEYEKARKQAEYRIAVTSIPATDLKLKELLIDDYIFMYGFNEKKVVILFFKHQKQVNYL